MIRIGDSAFREVWLVDFEFSAPPGQRPTVVCLVAWELRSGSTLRIWQDELQGMDGSPYAVDRGALFVAYYASAEMGCHLALGWPLRRPRCPCRFGPQRSPADVVRRSRR